MDRQRFKLNGPKGLGDAIYMRALALHLIAGGERVEVRTRWPEVFSDLPIECRSADKIENYDEQHHMVACLHCQVPLIRPIAKFRLACLQAGIEDDVALDLGWKIRNRNLVEDIARRASGRPVLVFQPLKKAVNLEQEIAQPKSAAYAAFVAERADHFRVKIGHADYLELGGHPPCDLDLVGRTSVPDLFDLVMASDLVFAESSFLSVLAQAADRPLVCMFSRRALRSDNKRLSGATPERMFSKPALARAIYDE